jgi:hypothetical protein
MRRRLPALSCVLALAACVTASVESRPLTPEELYSPAKGQTLEGVIYYNPRPYLLTYMFAVYDPAASKPPGDHAATDSCARTVQMTQLQVMPDFAHPFIMTSVRHGIGTAQLSVSLKDGMIAGVNAEGSSTLAGTLSAITSGAVDISHIVRAAPPPGAKLPLCNAGPVLAKIEPVDWNKLPLVFMPDTTRKK